MRVADDYDFDIDDDKRMIERSRNAVLELIVNYTLKCGTYAVLIDFIRAVPASSLARQKRHQFKEDGAQSRKSPACHPWVP